MAIHGNETVRGRSARFAALLLGSTVLAGIGAGLPLAPALAQDETTTLDRLLFQGSSYETEDSDSYTTDLISVGEKDVRPVREIPQSTTVITHERLEDGKYTSLDTVLRETPGIVVLNNDDGRSSIFSRGFEFDYLYFNGLPAPVSSVYGTQPDMAIVDHIEILRGPAGLFGGAGEPAGAINMRLKQPKDAFEANFNARYGSWEHMRGEVDVTGPINDAGTVRGRFVGALQSEGSWVDTVENGVGVGYGTVQADIAENTTATFSVSHMQRDITPFNGLPTYQDGTLVDLDRGTFTGASWNSFDNDVTDYIAEVEHKFDDGGHAKLSARYQVANVDFLYAWANGYVASNGDIVSGGGDTADSRWLARDYESRALSIDAHVSKPFEAFGQEHNVILGMDYQDQDLTTLQGAGTITVDQNIYDWNTDLAKPTVNYTSQTNVDPQQFGIYGQLRIKPVEPLTLIGGGRVTWYDATTTNLVSGAETSQLDVDNRFTPYAGAVYDLTDWLSAYASYTAIFQPQAATDVNGEQLDPREGGQYEVGLKAELFDGVNASLAYFNLRDENRAVTDPDNPGFSAALGEVEAQGVEVEASGEVLPGWQLSVGYTYTDTEYLNTTSAGTAGTVFSTYTPEHMVQVWTKYTFDENQGLLAGFHVGAGLKAFSSFSAGSIEAPAYTTVDLLAGYKVSETLAVSLNVNNVFDEKYYARVGSTSVFNFYGEPRSAVLEVSAKF
jgi:outer membrane receptor for ferric coprogen and ferric-rhodotorulic acid